MSNEPRTLSLEEWVSRVAADPVALRQRRAMEIVLHSIARLLPKHRLYLKGGVLMGLVHKSPRQTTDIDLTAGFNVEPGIGERVAEDLRSRFRPTAAELGYTGITVDIHAIRTLPRGRFDTADFPGLKIRIVHAERPGSTAAGALYFDIDISFNEPLQHVLAFRIADDRDLCTYALVDLIAEKYRAVLQQPHRCRERRQDIFDLHYLTVTNDIGPDARRLILDSLLIKCRAQD